MFKSQQVKNINNKRGYSIIRAKTINKKLPLHRRHKIKVKFPPPQPSLPKKILLSEDSDIGFRPDPHTKLVEFYNYNCKICPPIKPHRFGYTCIPLDIWVQVRTISKLLKPHLYQVATNRTIPSESIAESIGKAIHTFRFLTNFPPSLVKPESHWRLKKKGVWVGNPLFEQHRLELWFYHFFAEKLQIPHQYILEKIIWKEDVKHNWDFDF